MLAWDRTNGRKTRASGWVVRERQERTEPKQDRTLSKRMNDHLQLKIDLAAVFRDLFLALPESSRPAFVPQHRAQHGRTAKVIKIPSKRRTAPSAEGRREY